MGSVHLHHHGPALLHALGEQVENEGRYQHAVRLYLQATDCGNMDALKSLETWLCTAPCGRRTRGASWAWQSETPRSVSRRSHVDAAGVLNISARTFIRREHLRREPSAAG
ncbi:hypothetical protein KBX08_33265 [Micromonospora sp. H61]|uniref:hypothetical protein n=1 Tax=Micromonospora sp. H61 TaxID=2824888 RepID=UPI001B393135|nr:hypothetical protein [Micromonospora sp. H61]MBQ0994922.1 hypothetical protein [Micromonospora sp. H61]